MGVVIFDIAKFRVAYPMFASVSDDLLQVYFDRACLYLDNTPNSPVVNLNERSILLNLLVAHITQLNSGINGQAPTGMVGRITSASQGSVSVSSDYGTVEKGQAWFIQTAFGAEYWQLTAKYRIIRYIPKRR